MAHMSERDTQMRADQMRDIIMEKLVQTGEKDNLKDMLRANLIQSGDNPWLISTAIVRILRQSMAIQWWSNLDDVLKRISIAKSTLVWWNDKRRTALTISYHKSAVDQLS